MPRWPLTFEERFWSKVDKSGDCWLWTAHRQRAGYGTFKVVTESRQVSILAHRVAYELTHGPFRPDLNVCHHCDVRACVRPDHLFLGTAKDNVEDMIAKGRDHRVAGEGHPEHKLTQAQVDEIRLRWIPGKKMGPVLASAFGVTRTQIYNIVHDKSWKSRESFAEWSDRRAGRDSEDSYRD